MFQKKKLRKEYDRRLIELMDSTKHDWLSKQQLESISYESEELSNMTMIAQAKYFFLFHEAKKRKVSLR
ncbi:YaaL family protein [Pseudogracilibacillus auburnensis]|uniref:YaaL family protein n=1 Tax=Pseudogracilibacillus auburnensis TaxID=1494959 RepID=UPI001A973E74|nr:YaaL family protein [Pseudogracilibacillus auburnensis]